MAVCFTLALAPGALASTIGVSTESDSVADDGACSLREAITSANLDAASGVSAGECTAGSAADTITLPPGTFATTRAGAAENDNSTGDLDVAGDLAVRGAGAAFTAIDGGRLDRVLDIIQPRTVSIEGVTVTGGRSPNGLNGGPGVPGASGGGGAGIRNNSGPLTVVNSVVRDNLSGAGGNGGAGAAGVGGPGGGGGGISSLGPLTLMGSAVLDNVAGSGGGGGSTTGGDGSPNSGSGDGGKGVGADGGAGGAGGGVLVSGAFVMTASTVADNIAGEGGKGGDGHGGLAGYGDPLNGGPGDGGSADGGAGGPGGIGGGVAASAIATVTSSTFAGNRGGHGGTGGSANGEDGLNGSATASGSNGGTVAGGKGGLGGRGGAVSAQAGGGFTNVTFDHNVAGTGGTGGLGSNQFGGKGGEGGDGTSGGHGGDAIGGFGGAGGNGGALATAATATVSHGTFDANHGGAGGPGTRGTPGLGGDAGSNGGPPGDLGSNTSGDSGAPGLGGGSFSVIGTTQTVSNSVFARNDPASCGFTLTDGGHDVTFPFGCPGTLADPRLGPLAANGGPVETRALGAGSGAIDVVPATGAGCPATDARAVPRPSGAGCDAGAYERAPAGAATGGPSSITTASATVAGDVTPYGRPALYHFDYGTTPAYGSRTADADAGGGITAVPVTAVLAGLAASTTYHYRLVAVGGDGSGAGADQSFTTAAPDPGPGPGPGPGGDTTPPLISAASVAPARTKRATKFLYTLSEPAHVAFTIQRSAPGRKVAKKCRKPARSNRRGPKCRRYVRVTRLSQNGAAGANVKRFSGKVRGKTLRPRRYRLTLLAIDAAGNRSLPTRLRFAVVAR